MSATPLDARAVAAFREDFSRLESCLANAVVGQDPLVRELLVAVLAGGHVLLEGLPGLGKTHLAKGLARAIGQRLARVQCTPDLLPSDITGSEMLVGAGSEEGPELRFRPGPIFGAFVLVDEINRATPRTQSALLEAMQEGHVTQGGREYGLPQPFWVIATQNPIELEGTYPLPEAQLDRFFFKCRVPYPSADALSRIADVSLDAEPADRIELVVSPDRLKEMMQQTRAVVIPDAVRRDAVALVLATHPERRDGGGDTRDPHAPSSGGHLRYGASPRALQTLLRAARVVALAEGRGHVDGEDLRRAALPALRHRVMLSIESEVAGVDVDDVLRELLASWARPR